MTGWNAGLMPLQTRSATTLRLRSFGILVSMLLISSCRSQPDVKRELLPFGSFAPPMENQTLSGNVVVGGWAIHESGIASVRLYLDREYLLDANIGVNRPDVAAVYKNINKDKISGWNALLDAAHLPPGPHELIAQVCSKSGSQRDFTVHVLIAEPPQ